MTADEEIIARAHQNRDVPNGAARGGETAADPNSEIEGTIEGTGVALGPEQIVAMSVATTDERTAGSEADPEQEPTAVTEAARE